MRGGGGWGGGKWWWENGDNCTGTTIKNDKKIKRELAKRKKVYIKKDKFYFSLVGGPRSKLN